MATIFNVISVMSAAIGLVGFMESNLPDGKRNPMDSSVRIAVALNGDKGVRGALRHAAGEAPLVQAFNENQHLCGATNNFLHPYIHSGSFMDLTVSQSKLGPGEQATSLQIIPTTNELCIAYISQTWADGTHRGWVGDMGKGCDRDWYYSNIILGDDHKPSESQTHKSPKRKRKKRKKKPLPWANMSPSSNQHAPGSTTTTATASRPPPCRSTCRTSPT